MTAYDPDGIAHGGLDGGKVLLRIADDDAGTAPTLEACAQAVSALARRGLPIMVEPLPYHVTEDGSAKLLDDDDKLLRAVAVAAAIGTTTAYTWLKVPAGPSVRRMLSVSTLPTLILGGAPGPDPEAAYASWADAMTVPTVRGLVVGRALLYPADGDVAAAIERAAGSSAPLREVTMADLHHPAGSLVDGADPVALTPEDAGWRYCGLRVLRSPTASGASWRPVLTRPSSCRYDDRAGASRPTASGSCSPAGRRLRPGHRLRLRRPDPP